LAVRYTLLHAADLAANLPLESRCMRALEPTLEWSMQDRLLAESVNMLRLLVWAQSKDGHKGRNRPKMVELSKAKSSEKKPSLDRGFTADEYRKQLKRTRK